MSFPFYSRPSSKIARSKDQAPSDSHRASTSHAHATAAKVNFERNGDAIHETPGHARTSSKMRIFPFLVRKRKSIAALRTSGISTIDYPARGSDVNDPADPQRGMHYKTVSQLANETAARMAHSSSRPGPNVSAELPTLSVSPLRLGLDLTNPTPSQNGQNVRHSFSPGSTVSSSTPTKATQQAAKRASDKPKSFLSRVTSRPSLTFRYSSADLKSASKSSSRLFNRTPEKISNPINSSHPIVMVPVAEPVQRRLGDDRDFFTSPRVAPTPPNLTFTPSESFSQDSLLVSSQKAAFKADDLATSTRIRSTEEFRRRVKSDSPSVASQVSLSPDLDRRSAARSRHSHSISSATVMSSSEHSPRSLTAAPRTRNGVVRIGREEVTLSVANVLENELGVDVGDSDEESEYGEESRSPKFKSTSPKRFASLGPPPGVLPILPDSSDLPRLCPSQDDLDLGLSINSGSASQNIPLESQSPLSALISGASTKSTSSSKASPLQRSNIPPEQRTSSPPTVERRDEEQRYQSIAIVSHRQNRSFGALDRISERSLQLGSDNSCSPRQSSIKTEPKASDKQADTVTRLQQSLDSQCARFDRLARHLLEIIQRHTTEKLALETRISTLERDVRSRDREIKGLRWLVDNMRKASEEKRNSHKHGRSSSMQSLTFGTSGQDKQADLSAIAAMLSIVARDEGSAANTLKQENRLSVEVNPDLLLNKEKSLRRAKTLPDMHGAGVGRGSGIGVTPPLPTQSPSPDISGVGLGLEFPLPEPLTLRSIASTLLSTAGSNSTVPSLTSASTVASGMSVATLPSAAIAPTSIIAESSPPKRGRLNSSEKRKAGEWHPGAVAHYRPSPTEKSSSPGNVKADSNATSAAYANNLNKGRAPNIVHVLRKAESTQSMDFDSIFEKLVANAEEFLDQ